MGELLGPRETIDNRLRHYRLEHGGQYPPELAVEPDIFEGYRTYLITLAECQNRNSYRPVVMPSQIAEWQIARVLYWDLDTKRIRIVPALETSALPGS